MRVVGVGPEQRDEAGARMWLPRDRQIQRQPQRIAYRERGRYIVVQLKFTTISHNLWTQTG